MTAFKIVNNQGKLEMVAVSGDPERVTEYAKANGYSRTPRLAMVKALYHNPKEVKQIARFV